MVAERLIASLGSAVGNFAMFGAIVAGWPGFPLFSAAYARPGDQVLLDLGFKPYLVPGRDYAWPPRQGPQCPQPHLSRWSTDLEDSPLPLDFDPAAWPGRRLYACVRLDADGDVMGVALIGVEQPSTARALAGTIRRKWRFSPLYEQDGGWMAVRLNSGLGEPPTMPSSRE